MEPKGAFAKAFQKTLNRTKAKVLQNLGKADRTTDEQFEEHVANFTRQQTMACKLHKEMKHYVTCVKAMTTASKNLYSVIKEACESEWIELHTVDSSIRSLDMLQCNYEAELLERVTSDLHTYVELFNPMKEKISKWRRKLLDYDDAKHSYDSACNAKKPDDIRISRASESLQEAERMYNSLNTELHKELPKFYKYRIDFIASNLSRLYSTETTYHLETGKITDELRELMETVSKESSQSNVTSYTHNSIADKSELNLSTRDSSTANKPAEFSENEYSDVDDGNHQTPADQRLDDDSYIAMDVDALPKSVLSAHSPAAQCHPTAHPSLSPAHPVTLCQSTETFPHQSQSSERRRSSDDGETILLAEAVVTDDSHAANASSKAEDDEASLYQNVETDADLETESASEKEIAAGQQVLVTHNYTAEDEDELSLEVGEIIEVISFEDPDDEDEGWLMGCNKKSGRKGVFPVNFTRRIVPRNSNS